MDKKHILLLSLPLLLSACGSFSPSSSKTTTSKEEYIRVDYHSEYLLDLINPNHWEIPAHTGKFELKPIPSTDDYTFIKWVKYMFGPSYDPE